ncbi:metallophosphoesterase [Magnetococcus marinus MC-1]|uniref:Metallophosphoesterase n=1 Tax=Magnetococcus marinus (strain ATCC BAA-1437 / JCM 17883 / MC-1) TaxID=156889 RepID=A0L4X8_MAGMM|nr:TIGR00282 family metallophosphoesterase [Magnetococcus marinus]ABK43021.1 metallophosphoesterase [Magnetococcus marinus MC-1]
MSVAAKGAGQVRILILGDIVGRPGRNVVNEHLADLKKELELDLVVANAENATNGNGLTPKTADQLFNMGIDLITTGNHVWHYSELIDEIQQLRRVLRPANYPPGAPGHGHGIVTTRSGIKVGVINLIGRVFMNDVDCPFRAADALLDKIHRECDIILVDMHAEATSEKLALGIYLDGRVTAVVGTHTHVPTADHRVMPGGTGLQSDLGMCGVYINSVIGVKPESVVNRFVNGMPARHVTQEGPAMLCGALITAEAKNGRCVDIQPVRRGVGLTPAP